MINLIISGQPPAIVPSSNIPDKISPFSVQPARASLYLMRADRTIRELAAMTQRLRTTLPRKESALLQTLQYSPYFACCALFS